MVGDKIWGRWETLTEVKVQGTYRIQSLTVHIKRERFYLTVNRFTSIRLHSPDGNILVFRSSTGRIGRSTRSLPWSPLEERSATESPKKSEAQICQATRRLEEILILAGLKWKAQSSENPSEQDTAVPT